MGKETTTEECSTSINPKFDLARRNSSDISIFAHRSKSLSNMRSNLSYFKDTTKKKMLNNKLMEEEEHKNRNFDDTETKFKFKVFLMFMQLMKQGKDPIPYVLEMYL